MVAHCIAQRASPQQINTTDAMRHIDINNDPLLEYVGVVDIEYHTRNHCSAIIPAQKYKKEVQGSEKVVFSSIVCCFG